VQRGVWVLENIVGAPVPTPPPVVPPLEESAGTKTNPRTLREQMRLHTERPFCAGCHKIMDPVGFAMENFDGVGRWRAKEDQQPIDATGTLFTGAKIDGINGLRREIATRPDVFVGVLTERMLTYALGRTLDHDDMPVLRSIVRDAARHNYSFASIVLGVANSVPFRMRTVPEIATSEAVAAAE